MSLDENQLEQLIALLQQLEQGELPLPVFLQFARLGVLSIIELVPLRVGQRGVEVLLVERDTADPIWAGQLHTPGTVVRPADADYGVDGVLSRLAASELPGATFLKPPVQVATLVHRVKRGVECATIFYGWVETEATVGTWYRVTDLPEKLVATQRDFILLAAHKFIDDNK